MTKKLNKFYKSNKINIENDKSIIKLSIESFKSVNKSKKALKIKAFFVRNTILFKNLRGPKFSFFI